MRLNPLALLAALALPATLAAQDAPQDPLSVLRGPAPLTEEPEPPRLAAEENEDLRRARNYPEQPPTIPHKIEGYQIDANFNKCLSCHSREATGASQAPMVSVTHFMDRDGQFLAAVSPRRYFCNQCHVPQHEVEAPVANLFQDVDTVIRQLAGGAGGD